MSIEYDQKRAIDAINAVCQTAADAIAKSNTLTGGRTVQPLQEYERCAVSVYQPSNGYGGIPHGTRERLDAWYTQQKERRGANEAVLTNNKELHAALVHAIEQLGVKTQQWRRNPRKRTLGGEWVTAQGGQHDRV